MIVCKVPQQKVSNFLGFTMIELIVSLTVISILVSLLMPAIQSARETSRRIECQSHLKQIGIALHNYHDVNSAFPGKQYWPRYDRALSSYLEVSPDATYSKIFSCPSDSYAFGNLKAGEISYAMSDGVHDLRKNGDGFWGRSDFRKARDFVDGMSQTAAISEHIMRPDSSLLNSVDVTKLNRRERRWFQHRLPQPVSTSNEMADGCVTPTLVTTKNKPNVIIYSHLVKPNGFDCFNGYFQPQTTRAEAVTAMSDHPGGVNVLMADGSVHFVADTISREIWWAIGTRDGSEVVNTLFN